MVAARIAAGSEVDQVARERSGRPEEDERDEGDPGAFESSVIERERCERGDDGECADQPVVVEVAAEPFEEGHVDDSLPAWDDGARQRQGDAVQPRAGRPDGERKVDHREDGQDGGEVAKRRRQCCASAVLPSLVRECYEEEGDEEPGRLLYGYGQAERHRSEPARDDARIEVGISVPPPQREKHERKKSASVTPPTTKLAYVTRPSVRLAVQANCRGSSRQRRRNAAAQQARSVNTAACARRPSHSAGR